MDSDVLWGLVAITAIVFLCREINCWYLKINSRKELLEKIVANQEKIIELLNKRENEEVPEVHNQSTEE